jgi:hypothetical protein
MSEIIVIGVIGSAVVGVAIVENRLERIGKHVEAETINMVLSMILKLGGIGGAVWFIWNMVKTFIGGGLF